MNKESMVFYKSFYDSIKTLPDTDKIKLYEAIFEYGLLIKKEFDFDGFNNSIWTLIKPQLDANIKKYNNGKKGGRPQKKPKVIENKNQKKPKVIESENLRLLKNKPNVNDNVNDNVNVNVNDNVNKKVYPSIPNSEKLTLDEQEKAASQIVVDHFTSKGFKATDICIFTNQHIKRQDRFDSEVAMTMPKVNRAFYSWVYANNITNIQVLQHHIKMVQNQKINSSYAVIKQAIELIRTAVVNKWKNLYFDKIKK